MIVILCAGISLSEAQEQNQSLGELKLEGKYIERLVLERKDGGTEKFQNPAEIIGLPVGEYRLQQVRLGGGYTHNLNVITPESEWMTVSKDEPAVLKVGAPLQQKVEVKRQGRYLILNYKLLGGGGESYTSSSRDKPPIFTVSKGDKEIASDKFQFG